MGKLVVLTMGNVGIRSSAYSDIRQIVLVKLFQA